MIKQDVDVAHDVHSFSVACEATLPQMVKLLYDFYSQDYMHRIKQLSATPTKDKRLNLKFTIEAVSLPDVPERDLVDLPANRLAYHDLKDYFDVIVARQSLRAGQSAAQVRVRTDTERLRQ